jgi:hypothetical protein
VNGTSYEESYLASIGVYNSNNSYNFNTVATQGSIIKIISLNAGTNTIGIQARSWFGTNCSNATWGVNTASDAGSGGATAAWCKLVIVEN